MGKNNFQNMWNYIVALQDKICETLEKEDGGKFSKDHWEISEKGEGVSRIIQGGEVFEKGGVNISRVQGKLPEKIARVLNSAEGEFRATGLSLVIHPYSPRIPTIHMNIRYFEMNNGKSWFGGGMDLTPFYPHTVDFKFFHQKLYETVESILPGKYQEFKEYCDHYFYIPHRKEMRGIGGIFLDHLDGEKAEHFALVQAVGDSFIPIYGPIIQKRKSEKFTEMEKKIQLFRRGRYVEFNLLYDRGTKFGLEWGGSVEAILMSLPLKVEFPYNWHPETESEIYRELKVYFQARDWMDTK